MEQPQEDQSYMMQTYEELKEDQPQRLDASELSVQQPSSSLLEKPEV